MKLLLVDDHYLIGKSLEMTLKNYPEISEFLFLPDPSKAIEVVSTYQPNIVLMDIHMGEYNGLELGEELIKKFAVKLVFLSGFNLIEYRKKAISIGAYGFLDKHIAVDELVEKLNIIVLENQKIFDNQKNNLDSYNLTDREKEILQLIFQGVKQTAVASDLGISERTVRNHIYLINEKLETNTAVEAVIKAIEMGIINVHLQ